MYTDKTWEFQELKKTLAGHVHCVGHEWRYPLPSVAQLSQGHVIPIQHKKAHLSTILLSHRPTQ